MKYNKNERLAIGKLIYDKKTTIATAAKNYKLNYYTVRDYFREYKASIDSDKISCGNLSSVSSDLPLKDYEDMNRDELLEELLKSKINEARAKKGYIVKGGGANKKFIPLNSMNSK